MLGTKPKIHLTYDDFDFLTEHFSLSCSSSLVSLLAHALLRCTQDKLVNYEGFTKIMKRQASEHARSNGEVTHHAARALHKPDDHQGELTAGGAVKQLRLHPLQALMEVDDPDSEKAVTLTALKLLLSSDASPSLSPSPLTQSQRTLR